MHICRAAQLNGSGNSKFAHRILFRRIQCRLIVTEISRCCGLNNNSSECMYIFVFNNFHERNHDEHFYGLSLGLGVVIMLVFGWAFLVAGAVMEQKTENMCLSCQISE